MDAFILGFDRALRALGGVYQTARPNPALAVNQLERAGERQHAAALMRVNHSGEVCAQALYQAQAILSSKPAVAVALQQAAVEEGDHLRWTVDRIGELGGRRSMLDPLWYAGSFAIGLFAAKSGDAYNLGFLRETERQVVSHLTGHLEKLPANDERSRQILRQMIADEASHAKLAEDMGGARLPLPVISLMRVSAKFMTTIAFLV